MRASQAIGRAAPPSLWRNRNYLLLLGGQAISTVGTQVSQIGYPLLALALTRSPIQAGLLSAVRTLPYLVLGLPAGALVDRWDRKRLMILCDSGRALALGSIPLALALGHLTLAQLYVVALVEGAFNAFFNLAETAALTHVVPKEQIPEATARNEVTLSTGSTLGPALGGIVFGLGVALPFALDAISYAVSVVSVRFITVELNEERTAVAGGVRALLAEIREGMAWLWAQRLMRFLALLAGGANLVESGSLLAVILLAQRMHASAAAIGLILAAGGAGSIGGALLSGPLMRRLAFGRLTLGVFWLWALLLPLYAVAPNPAALGLITMLSYGVVPIFFATQYSYRLQLVPDALLGRVNGVFRLALFGGQPLGLALAGPLLERLGAVPTILVFAGVLALLALAATLNPHVRTAPSVAVAVGR